VRIVPLWDARADGDERRAGCDRQFSWRPSKQVSGEKIETNMNIDSYFLILVFEEYFSDRDAVRKALSVGDGGE
jgi:hypothetical protein